LINEEYANTLKKDTLKLFDILQPKHGIDDKYKDELKVAAKLSSIGSSINYYRSNEHSFYLILNSLLDVPVLYLSSYIIEHKSEYYKLLNRVRKEGAWEEWVLYILKGVEQTSLQSVALIEKIVHLMNDTKRVLKHNFSKFYSKDLLEILFKHPYTKIVFLINELGVTRKTATSYLKELEAYGILKSIKVGREIYFVNIKLFELLQMR
jgi:hypothetical protein